MSAGDARVAGIAERMAALAVELHDIAHVADVRVALRIDDVRELLDAVESGRPVGGPALARLCEATGRAYLQPKREVTP